MKNLMIAASLVGISFSSLGSPVVKSEHPTVKYDKGKHKKKGHKKSKHKKCEAYKG